MDAYSTRLVGYSIGERMTADLAVSALRNAIALRDPVGTSGPSATEDLNFDHEPSCAS